MARRGILVTSLGDQIPFSGFMTTETLLLLERSTPDSMGARTVILPYESVTAVKLTDVTDSKSFRTFGFVGEMK